MKQISKYLTILLLCLNARVASAQGIIISIAGNGITQYIGDGYPATNYSLALPMSVFVDKHGVVYVADDMSQRIQKIDHDTLSTIAGTGIPGYRGDGGLADTAELRQPDGIYFDTAGNWYITEWYNDVVRKVNGSTGIITTVCGNGTGGFGGDGGGATGANMETPSGAVVDDAGNIYIPDYGNHRVRKVNIATGTITTIAGNGTNGYSGDNGPATDAHLSYPDGLSLDNTGNLYVSEYGNSTIRKINLASGIITTVTGNGTQGFSGDNGPAKAAILNRPYAVFADKMGYVYICDYENNVVRAINPSGIIATIAGSGAYGYTGDGGPATAATFRGPSAVFVDDSGYIYIGDGVNSVIRKVSPLYSVAGVANVGGNISLGIFPNPSTGNFVVSGTEDLADNRIDIFNTIGQNVHSSKPGNTNTFIDITNRPAGLYIMQYHTASGNCTQKVVITR